MTTLYNEIDPFACRWLDALMQHGHITDGKVEPRSIADVKGSEIERYERVHLFAGIAGWDYALRLAGWPAGRPVWTGSCPCQPFSAAGKRTGTDDARHLWPEMFRLIKECRPPVIFGEQVASSEVVGTQQEAAFVVAVQRGDYARANKLAKRLAQSNGFHFWARWVDGIQADLASAGYAFRFAVLGAHSVRAPHIRQRLYWVAYLPGERFDGRAGMQRAHGRGLAEAGGQNGGLEHAQGDRREQRRAESGGRCVACGCGSGGVVFPDSTGREPGQSTAAAARYGCSSESAGGADGMADPERLGRDGRAPEQGRGAEQGIVAGRGSAGGYAGLGNTGCARREELAGRWDEPEGPAAPSGLNPWADYDVVWCRDPKGGPDIARRVEPGTFPLVNGATSRVGRLRGYGNAIVSLLAAEFVMAFLETEAVTAAKSEGR